jgi:hypothetical protein
MVVYTFNVSTQNEETGGSLRFEASLVYIWSSRIARDTQRDSVSKNKNQKKKKKSQNNVSGTLLENPTKRYFSFKMSIRC